MKNTKTEVYYDKIKGIAVSSYYESIDTFGAETEAFTEMITNSNSDVWTVPGLPVFIIPLLVAAASASLVYAKVKMDQKCKY